MTSGPIIRLVGQRQRDYAKRQIDLAPDGHVCRIVPPTRNLEQNARLHAMLADIQKQVPEMHPYTLDDMRLRFLDALGAELRFLPKLEGAGMFPVGLKSSTLTVEQFSALIELVAKYGAEHQVRWSEPNPYERSAA